MSVAALHRAVHSSAEREKKNNLFCTLRWLTSNCTPLFAGATPSNLQYRRHTAFKSELLYITNYKVVTLPLYSIVHTLLRDFNQVFRQMIIRLNLDLKACAWEMNFMENCVLLVQRTRQVLMLQASKRGC